MRPVRGACYGLRLTVWVDDWQMQCCGPPFAIGDEFEPMAGGSPAPSSLLGPGADSDVADRHFEGESHCHGLVCQRSLGQCQSMGWWVVCRSMVDCGRRASYGAFTAPLVAERVAADALVLVAGMVPAPGEPPDDWWDNVGYAEAVAERAAADGGLTGNEDPFVGFYHDVPRALAEESLARERAHPSAASGAGPWPLAAWSGIRTGSIVCTEDRFLPPGLQRRLARGPVGRRAGRDRRRPLRRAQPAGRAGRPACRVRVIAGRFPMLHGELDGSTANFLWTDRVSHAAWETCDR